MPIGQPSYTYEEILACGRGELFGPGNAQLPLPPMLMFDRITSIKKDGGSAGLGSVTAELDRQSQPARLVIHPQLTVARDADGTITALAPSIRP